MHAKAFCKTITHFKCIFDAQVGFCSSEFQKQILGQFVTEDDLRANISSPEFTNILTADTNVSVNEASSQEFIPSPQQ